MQAPFIDGIFYVVILIMSVVIHEVAHGYMAYRLGDDTAQASGRLTLNPLKHLDPLGSVIVPLLLILTNSGFIIGWAKPVPYNPNNLRNIRRGTFLVSVAGIMANILIAVIFGLLIRFAPMLGIPPYSPGLAQPFYRILTIIVFMNIILAFFNLIPIPPLDGSKILFSALSPKYRYIENFLERYGIFILLIFIVFIWNKLAPILYLLFSLITGIAF